MDNRGHTPDNGKMPMSLVKLDIHLCREIVTLETMRKEGNSLCITLIRGLMNL